MRRSSVLPTAILFAALALPGLAPRPVHAQTPGDLPYVSIITLLPLPPCDSLPTRLVVGGYFPTSCGQVLGNSGTTIYIRDPAPSCGERCEPVTKAWADTLDLGLLAAGTYQVPLTLAVVDPCGPDTVTYSTQVAFAVGTQCPENPPLDPMNYVTSVKITSTRDTTSALICEGDSILLRVGGVFPDDCHILRSIQLGAMPSPASIAPSPAGAPAPPFNVRLVFDNTCCATRICVPFPTQWEGSIVIPPQPSGLHNFLMDGFETCCRDEPVLGDPYGVRSSGFTVTTAESCGIEPPPVTCLWPTWLHDQTAECDGFVSKTGDPATITGMVHSTVPLAGIQGAVHAYSPNGIPLMVQSMEPIGLAAGMHLTWEPTSNGAKFVLFAEQGAPLPITSPRRPTQFLRIHWVPGIRDTRQNGILPDSTRWHVAWNDVFGSDFFGNLVPLCPLGTPGIFADVANICLGAPSLCDLNGDRQSDVRDLVLMSHCLIAPGACPWDPSGLDCEGDDDVDFDDLYCCARHVLGVPPCPDCPDDSVRTEPGIAVAFGTPVRDADVIEIPVRIDGIGRLGAARLTLTLPPGLAQAATFDMQDPTWLNVTRADGDRLEIGLISLSIGSDDRFRAAQPVLRLTVPAGSVPSGQVALEAADLSGPDGVKLRADLGTPVVRLGPGVGASLSPARPNPFNGSTSFRLTLDAAAEAEVGVYDLSGRRVATLHKGPLPIGSHPFVWDGRVDGGTRARAGVFFVRATVAGRSSMQKLVMLKQ